MRATQLACVLGSIAALIALTGCSVETLSGAVPDAIPSEDSGRDAPSGDSSVDPAEDAQNDSARDTSTADTAVDLPDTSPYASDPKNCGAAGHDCLGRSCSSGMCAVDTVRTNAAVGGAIDSFIIRDANLYLVARQSGGTALRRGPVTPGASDSLLFPVTSDFGLSSSRPTRSTGSATPPSSATR